MKPSTHALALTISGLVLQTANAAIFNIPDGTGDPLELNFNLTDLGGPISSLELSLNLTHTWVGDLEISLHAPPASGLSFVLLERVGQTTSDPDDFGDSSNLNGVYRFVDSGNSLWSAATALGDTSSIPSGNYHPSRSNDGSATSFATDSGFIGMHPSIANGVWTLRIEDVATQDIGSVSDVGTILSISWTPVPEPREYALMAGFGLAGLAWFRRAARAKRPLLATARSL